MRVYILDNGYLECDSNQMVAMSTVGTIDDPTPLHKWIKIPVYCVLIDHPQAKILYDTGSNPQAMKGYWPPSLWKVFPYTHTEDQLLENQLAKIGLKPQDIDIVVLSHLHLDHAGNLNLFKHADVYVDKDDFQNALIMTHTNPDPVTHGAYIKADVETPAKFRLVDRDFELLPGVNIIRLPGHTPGLLGVMVKLKRDGTLIFPMDAIYQPANYGPPPRFSGIVYDSLAFIKSIEKVREIATRENAKVMFSHDWEFFQTMKLAPEFYE